MLALSRHYAARAIQGGGPTACTRCLAFAASANLPPRSALAVLAVAKRFPDNVKVNAFLLNLARLCPPVL
jgi:hypothetical protein